MIVIFIKILIVLKLLSINLIGFFDSQILVMVDGGNPFSGPEWYLPSIGFNIDTEYQDDADAYFEQLTDSLETTDSTKSHFLLKLLDFFFGKETALLLRFIHQSDNQYIFCIETRGIPEDRYHYYNEIFVHSGLIEGVNAKEVPSGSHFWKIESDNLDDLLLQLNSITDYIIANFSYDIPRSLDEVVSFLPRAQYQRRTLSEQEFNEWLKEKGIEYGIITEEQSDGEKKTR